MRKGIAGETQSDERIGESEQHGDTHTDQEGRVDQTSQQEHLGLQCVHELGLASSAFQVLTTHDADADASAEGTQTDNDSASESNESNVGHDNSLVKNFVFEKVGQRDARNSCVPASANLPENS
jgi:hypothetical protein